MANPEFTAFNFLVEILPPGGGGSSTPYQAAFSECDGLEMNMAPKTIREGGNNTQPIHLSGPVTYGQLTLKRGMTGNFDLWEWFEWSHSSKGRGDRYDVEISIRGSDRAGESVRFSLVRCFPVKIKAPTLNAKDGLIAIEEMQLAYEGFSLIKPKAKGA